VGELLAECGDSPINFRKLALKKPFCCEVGNQKYLREINCLSIDGIVNFTRSFVEEVSDSKKARI
jgi:hypothetical protein